MIYDRRVMVPKGTFKQIVDAVRKIAKFDTGEFAVKQVKRYNLLDFDLANLEMVGLEIECEINPEVGAADLSSYFLLLGQVIKEEQVKDMLLQVARNVSALDSRQYTRDEVVEMLVSLAGK
jgi:hypothetical protein